MNKNLKWIAGTLAVILVFVGIYFLYGKLSKEYKGDQLGTVSKKPNSSDSQGSNSSEEKKDNPAPDFTVKDKDGNNVSLSDLKGKPVVINFWATWCGFCKVEMPDFEKMYKKYGDDIHFMMINATDGQRETVEKAKDYIKENKFTFPVYFDTQMDAINTYRVSGFPMTLFIDKDGNFITYANGALDAATLEKGINMIK